MLCVKLSENVVSDAVCEPIGNAMCYAVCEHIGNAVCEPIGNAVCYTVCEFIGNALWCTLTEKTNFFQALFKQIGGSQGCQ